MKKEFWKVLKRIYIGTVLITYPIVVAALLRLLYLYYDAVHPFVSLLSY